MTTYIHTTWRKDERVTLWQKENKKQIIAESGVRKVDMQNPATTKPAVSSDTPVVKIDPKEIHPILKCSTSTLFKHNQFPR